MQTGWLNINSWLFYANSSCVCVKGDHWINGKRYNFDENCYLTYKGWQNPNGFYKVGVENVKLPDKAYSYTLHYVTSSRLGLYATRQDCINTFTSRTRYYLGSQYLWN